MRILSFSLKQKIIRKLLASGRNIEITDDGITLRKVQRDQTGSYACVAMQKLGSLKNFQQRSIELTVERKKNKQNWFCKYFLRLTLIEDGPKPLRSETQTVTANVGESITLQCSVDSIPNSRFQWLLNGYEIFENVENFNGHSRLTVR